MQYGVADILYAPRAAICIYRHVRIVKLLFLFRLLVSAVSHFAGRNNWLVLN